MFGKLFKRKDSDDWTDTGVGSAHELSELAGSNHVVAAELKLFEEKMAQDPAHIEDHAVASAKALSGYGIAVAKSAFIEYGNQG